MANGRLLPPGFEPILGDSSLQSLYEDETVGSWMRRVRAVHREAGLASAHLESPLTDPADPDFGALAPWTDALPRSLRRHLRHAAELPSRYVAPPERRTQFCIWCQRNDLLEGREPYRRRVWSIEWVSTCARHGPLSVTLLGEPSNPWDVFVSEPQNKRHCVIEGSPGRDLKGTRGVFFIGTDVRAIWLETALLASNGGAAWRPNGLSQRALASLYSHVLLGLIRQYQVAPANGEWPRDLGGYTGPLGPMGRLWMRTRYALNVIAEAVISVWTRSPLPTTHASDARTRAVVQWAGWYPWRQGREPEPPLGGRSIWHAPEDITEVAYKFGLPGSWADLEEPSVSDVDLLCDQDRDQSRQPIIDLGFLDD